MSEGGPIPESNSNKAPAPEDGQLVLNSSVLVKAKNNGEQRIGVEGKYFAVFDREGLKDSGASKFHGHLRTWKQLSSDQRNALQNENITNSDGKILKKK